jgi:hypothetical protein
MPESPRKLSTASRKAEPEVVPAEPAAAKPANTAKVAKAAKNTEPAKKTTKAAAPGEPVEAPAPAKKATKSGGKAAKKAAAEPVEEPVAVPAQEPAEGESTDEPEFLNRAARRAKGHKGSSGLPVAGRGPTYSGRGAVPGQRQWGARRSGG